MNAVVHDKYGPPEVLRLEEVERPVPKDDEVLVKIHATTVNRTDSGLRSAELFVTRFFTGLLRPKRKILGDGASLALACLRKGDFREGRSIVVYGASGSVGTAGVQLATTSSTTHRRWSRRPGTSS
jgi:NADPH:quinone reductase-like Zn-dependent oxidoreductase